jgi:steroid delta-isomerase-like uncharacterized protein
MATDNIALAKRFIEEVWNKGNLNVVDELCAETCTVHDPMAKDLPTRDALKKHVQGIRAAFPDLRVNIDDVAASGDKVYVRWSSTGTHKGTLMGLPGTNKRSAIGGMSTNRVEGGKIAETWMYFDVLGLLQQLGIAPALDQFSRGVAANLGLH